MPNEKPKELKKCPLISAIPIIPDKNNRLVPNTIVNSCIGEVCTFWDAEEESCILLLLAQQTLDNQVAMQELMEQQQGVGLERANDPGTANKP